MYLGIIIGIIIVMYVMPVLDYFILFRINVAKTIEQYEIQQKYIPKEEEEEEMVTHVAGFDMSARHEDDEEEYEQSPVEEKKIRRI